MEPPPGQGLHSPRCLGNDLATPQHYVFFFITSNADIKLWFLVWREPVNMRATSSAQADVR